MKFDRDKKRNRQRVNGKKVVISVHRIGQLSSALTKRKIIEFEIFINSKRTLRMLGE